MILRSVKVNFLHEACKLRVTKIELFELCCVCISVYTCISRLYGKTSSFARSFRGILYCGTVSFTIFADIQANWKSPIQQKTVLY